MEEMRPTPGATSRRWAPKYRPLRFLLVVPLAMALALATSYHEASAAAVNQGPCQFFVNGVSSTQFDTQDHALHVASDQDLVISGKAPVAFRSWVAWIEFADFQYTAASGNSQKDTFSSTVNVKTYAKFGVGMYKVLSEAKLLPSNSPDCIADGYVLVDGNPMATAAGIGAAVTGALGLGGVLAGAGASSGEGKGTTKEFEEAEDKQRKLENDMTDVFPELGCLGCFTLPLALVGVLAAVGGILVLVLH